MTACVTAQPAREAAELRTVLTWNSPWRHFVMCRPAGESRVRVCAGLKVAHAGTAFRDETGPNSIGGVAGLAAGPDGRLYVLSPRGGRGRLHWRGTMVVHVFRRDGSYEQTIKPPPAHLPEDRLKAIGAFAHVDALCDLPRLQAIQILPGAGKPSPLHYLDVLRKVQARGKNLHITIEPDEVKTALSEVSARGLFIDAHCEQEDEARALLTQAEKWSRDRHPKTSA